MSKTKKLPARKEIYLELLHQRWGHRPTWSLLAGDTDNDWEYIEHVIDPEPFCTSCQISSMNKKAGYKILLKSKTPFKWGFMDIVPSTAPKFLTSDTTLSNFLSIVYAYSKIPKRYGVEKITAEEVMDKLDMFQSRFGEIDKFGWWDLEIIFSRYKYAVYINRFQKRMPNLQSSFDISGTGTSGNERKSWSDMDNVAYSCTLSYVTC